MNYCVSTVKKIHKTHFCKILYSSNLLFSVFVRFQDIFININSVDYVYGTDY